ncbi:MAG TPA: hypothetical protein VHX86_17590 [Tepidisphaeraceae bacterium]|jgi:hypothetical protein|nr:hypothetical protein [Tepidisphaeraceae bacterium]
MGKVNNGAIQAIFRKITDNGTSWLLIILANDGWAITRNGERVVIGANNGPSIGFGVRKYLSLTTAAIPQLQGAGV